jgi:hypothetical protein
MMSSSTLRISISYLNSRHTTQMATVALAVGSKSYNAQHEHAHGLERVAGID